MPLSSLRTTAELDAMYGTLGLPLRETWWPLTPFPTVPPLITMLPSVAILTLPALSVRPPEIVICDVLSLPLIAGVPDTTPPVIFKVDVPERVMPSNTLDSIVPPYTPIVPSVHSTPVHLPEMQPPHRTTPPWFSMPTSLDVAPLVSPSSDISLPPPTQSQI